MSTWTREQIEALSPDASSLKAANKLLNKGKWPVLGSNGIALWGECQGSGKKPYLTRIDLSEPAFKCSCPSRKFPCKHALALFMLFADDETSFTQKDAPDWVSEWLESRSSRKEAKAKKEDAPVDEAAQAKRIAAREKKIARGLDEFELWLQDLVRSGLMAFPAKPLAYVDDMAARLVDSQASGLARLLKELNDLPLSGEWVQEGLAKLGMLQIIVSAYRQQSHLAESVRADLRRVLGWTDNQKELLQQEGLKDDWLVLAQSVSQEEALRVRKSWLWGKASGQVALILEFAYGAQAFDVRIIAGQVLTAEMVFFESQYPLRAVLKDSSASRVLAPDDIAALKQAAHFDEVLEQYSASLAQNCWLEQFPVFVAELTPVVSEGVFSLIDKEGQSLALEPRFRHGWQLLALSGGRSVSVLAEWDGQVLLPLSVWQDELIMLEGAV